MRILANNKKSFLLGIFFFLIWTFFCFQNDVYALSGTISGEGVYFRKSANTSGKVLGQFKYGTVVSVNSTYTVNGAGCNAGWISITYNNTQGYVCKTYLDIEGSASYNRPWTSPKKAILGGAEFISSSYISKGQYNSYLKKFNVNPSGAYELYTHQYMANLAAPYSEARTTYNSYKANNLLSLPLQFVIPIFNNMPEHTAHPATGVEVGGTSVVSDASFEKQLNAEGFPETYKKWLRELHKSYPNWIFKSLKTGLDFYSAVEAEKWISSINKGGCPKCVDASNVNTEGNWYVGSTEVTAYFLDPRNFLMADSVLMFENLSYSDQYTEKVVKNVLSGTFMSGNDGVDKVSYSSMFMEAGKTYNVNPVYLAALSKQEVSSKGSISTSGERIDYKGNVYEGFYNFYNIGAYSSEESPVRAGIVYAAAGASKNAQGVFVGNISDSIPIVKPVPPINNGNNNNNNKPIVTPLSTHLSNMNLNKKGNYLTNISVGTTVGNLKNKTFMSLESLDSNFICLNLLLKYNPVH